MGRLSSTELRELATRNGSVNVPLASDYDLRWHDPFWSETWDRWQKAQNSWRETWPHVPFEQMLPDIYTLDPGNIEDLAHAACAREFLEARKAYKEATRLYLHIDEDRNP